MSWSGFRALEGCCFLPDGGWRRRPWKVFFLCAVESLYHPCAELGLRRRQRGLGVHSVHFCPAEADAPRRWMHVRQVQRLEDCSDSLVKLLMFYHKTT